jgi:pimeloyl-ACP methyl ester carboxylesterase
MAAVDLRPNGGVSQMQSWKDEIKGHLIFLPIFGALVILPMMIIVLVINYVFPQQYYSGVMLNKAVTYVSAGRADTTLKWLAQEGGQVRLSDGPTNTEWLQSSRDVTILVHGYNALESEITSYFEDTIAYLQQGSEARTFVVFDWPSGFSMVSRGGLWWVIADLFDSFGFETLVHEPTSYIKARSLAQGVGAEGFSDLLNFVQKHDAGPVTIVAHSMGSHLVIEALRQHPELAKKVGSLVLLAPAVGDDVFEESDVAAAIANIPKVDVYYSREDEVLKLLSGMLGSTGARDIQKAPKNVIFHDVTKLLGTSDVHSRYLSTEGLRAISLLFTEPPVR